MWVFSRSSLSSQSLFFPSLLIFFFFFRWTRLTHDISLDEFEDDDLSEITEITDERGMSLNCNGPDLKVRNRLPADESGLSLRAPSQFRQLSASLALSFWSFFHQWISRSSQDLLTACLRPSTFGFGAHFFLLFFPYIFFVFSSCWAGCKKRTEQVWFGRKWKNVMTGRFIILSDLASVPCSTIITSSHSFLTFSLGRLL